jgi:hypothetical protein
MTADLSQDRRVTVLNRGHKRPAPTEGSRLCWALPSPVHERSGYRASRPTGYQGDAVVPHCRSRPSPRVTSRLSSRPRALRARHYRAEFGAKDRPQQTTLS